MAKTPANAAAAQASAETDDEKEALFGGLTAEQRGDMTDAELSGIDGDETDDEDGDDDGADADTTAAETGADADAGDDAGEGDTAEGEGDDADGEDGEGGDDAGEAEGTDTAADADTGGDDADGDQDEDDQEDDLDVTRSVMPNEWQLPKDADEQLKGLNAQAGELADKFDAGDLTAREYQQQRDTLDDQRGTLKMQIHDAKQAWGKAMGDWSNRTVRAFLREHKQYGAENPTLNRMLDGEVRALQLGTNDPFNPRILRKAHANIQAAMGKTAPAADQAQPGKQAAKDGKSKTPVVPGKKPQVPPTLARVPQDEIDNPEGGKFARLDRLSQRDAHAFEEAMSRLSPKERDEYLASA